MLHKEYSRVIPGSMDAVVMIHGILGTPAHFAPLFSAIPERFSVYNLVLEGHGGSASDFSAASMAKWHAQMQTLWDSVLLRHRKVYIIAHSMGTLFAIRAAVDHPNKIAGLFLLSTPLCPYVHHRAMLASMRLAFGCHSEDHILEKKILADSGVRLAPHLWQYIGWIPRFWELLLEAGKVRRLLPQLTVPTLAYHCREDELVTMRSAKILAKHPAVRLTILEHSGHYAYRKPDISLLRKDLAAFLE